MKKETSMRKIKMKQLLQDATSILVEYRVPAGRNRVAFSESPEAVKLETDILNILIDVVRESHRTGKISITSNIKLFFDIETSDFLRGRFYYNAYNTRPTTYPNSASGRAIAAAVSVNDDIIYAFPEYRKITTSMTVALKKLKVKFEKLVGRNNVTKLWDMVIEAAYQHG